MLTLYQFRCSHFCEKARWALDHHRLPWQAVDLVPGRHVGTVRRLAAASTVPLLPDREHTLDFLLQGAPWHARALYTLFWPRIRGRMARHMRISPEGALQAERDLLSAFDRLDQALAQGRFLVGGRFSRADLTACALLARLCLPTAPADDPAGVRALRERVQQRRFFGWVGETYRDYRKSPGLR